jgi:hypothetical protein
MEPSNTSRRRRDGRAARTAGRLGSSLGGERLEARQLLTVVASTNANTDSASLIAAGGPGAGGTIGFVNVGESSTHNASVTYLGNRWVLTAGHVTIDNNLNTIRFGGVNYQADMSSITTILNPDNTPADLKVFRLTTDPGLPSILPSQIVSATPVGRQIMIGNGLSLGAQHFWHVNTAPTTWVWTSQSPPAHPGNNDLSGFDLVNGRMIRWGENMFDSPLTLSGGGITTKGYTTVFDNTLYTGVTPLASECQGSDGDSGGAVFSQEGGQWKLAGIIDAISDPLNGQPANTVLLGNATFMVDVSQYRTQILNVISGVADRQLFYAGSPKWDVTNANLPGFSDDNAIAPDKTAYLPGGGASTFANVSSYSSGINGVMVDLFSAHGTITANDFIFKVGNNNSPSTWATATGPTWVTTRAGAGDNGTDRVELLWANGAIAGNWLEVIVRGNDALGSSDANTGLPTSDVFYFGSAPADSGAGDSSGYLVNVIDEQSARSDPHGNANPASITNVNDFNRDGLVNSVDQLATRNFTTSNATQLKFLNIGAGGPFAPLGAAAVKSTATTAAGDAGIASALATASEPMESAATSPSGDVRAAALADESTAPRGAPSSALAASTDRAIALTDGPDADRLDADAAVDDDLLALLVA